MLNFLLLLFKNVYKYVKKTIANLIGKNKTRKKAIENINNLWMNSIN